MMPAAPKWFLPLAVAALLWNLLGCVAYLSDVTLTAADIARMSAPQQALYASRPAWAVAATALAVWGGALGCLGLILRKRWSGPLFVISLIGVICQDVGLFGMTQAGRSADPTALILQGLVLVVAVALVMLSRNAARQGWIA